MKKLSKINLVDLKNRNTKALQILLLLFVVSCNSLKKDPNLVTTKFPNGRTESKGVILDSNKIGPWYYYYSEVKKVKRYENYDSSSNLLEAINYYENGNTWHVTQYQNKHVHKEFYLKENGDTQYHFYHLKGDIYCLNEFISPSQKSLIGYKLWDHYEKRFYQHGTWKWFNSSGKVIRTKSY